MIVDEQMVWLLMPINTNLDHHLPIPFYENKLRAERKKIILIISQDKNDDNYDLSLSLSPAVYRFR